MALRGRAHTFGANVNTDEIIPARYLSAPDPQVWVAHLMEDIDAGFVQRVKPGDIIVAGTNFGCGSSREQAPVALKASGVSCVIASSFARIFFRNAINIGLPVLQCDGIADVTESGDEIEVSLDDGQILNATKGMTFHARPYPDFMLGITAKGGLVNYVRERLSEQREKNTASE